MNTSAQAGNGAVRVSNATSEIAASRELNMEARLVPPPGPRPIRRLRWETQGRRKTEVRQRRWLATLRPVHSVDKWLRTVRSRPPAP
jgi:hypothetical protein